VLHAGVDGVQIGERRLEVPHAGELPGMRRAVVPEVGSGNPVVLEPVPYRIPGDASVVRALNELPEPPGALRRVQPIRIGRRRLQMIHLPAPEVGTAHVPALACSVRGEDERALAGADQHTYSTHGSLRAATARWRSYPCRSPPSGDRRDRGSSSRT